MTKKPNKQNSIVARAAIKGLLERRYTLSSVEECCQNRGSSASYLSSICHGRYRRPKALEKQLTELSNKLTQGDVRTPDGLKNAARIKKPTIQRAHYNLKSFERGAADCAAGLQHKSGKSRNYDKGYSYQYALEQRGGA